MSNYAQQVKLTSEYLLSGFVDRLIDDLRRDIPKGIHSKAYLLEAAIRLRFELGIEQDMITSKVWHIDEDVFRIAVDWFFRILDKPKIELTVEDRHMWYQLVIQDETLDADEYFAHTPDSNVYY